jgi:hypothetical protein
MKSYINNKYKELDNLYTLLDTIKVDIESFDGYPSNWQEELELDELYLKVDEVEENIRNLQRFLYSIKKSKKYKKELLYSSSSFFLNC